MLTSIVYVIILERPEQADDFNNDSLNAVDSQVSLGLEKGEYPVQSLLPVPDQIDQQELGGINSFILIVSRKDVKLNISIGPSGESQEIVMLYEGVTGPDQIHHVREGYEVYTCYVRRFLSKSEDRVSE